MASDDPFEKMYFLREVTPSEADVVMFGASICSLLI